MAIHYQPVANIGSFQQVTKDFDITLTVETHNFPCGIAPFPGSGAAAGVKHMVWWEMVGDDGRRWDVQLEIQLETNHQLNNLTVDDCCDG